MPKLTKDMDVNSQRTLIRWTQRDTPYDTLQSNSQKPKAEKEGVHDH